MVSKNSATESQTGMDVRIAIYIRVPNQRHVHEGDSLEAQQDTINRHLESQKAICGWRSMTTTLFTDVGKSGKPLRRPAMQKMLQAVRRREFTHVIALKIDCVAGRRWDFLTFAGVLVRNHTSLVLLKESFDASHPYLKVLVHLIAAFAEMERNEEPNPEQMTMRNARPRTSRRVDPLRLDQPAHLDNERA